MRHCQHCNGYDSGPVTCWSCERRNTRELEGEREELEEAEADYRACIARLSAQIRALGAIPDLVPEPVDR